MFDTLNELINADLKRINDIRKQQEELTNNAYIENKITSNQLPDEKILIIKNDIQTIIANTEKQYQDTIKAYQQSHNSLVTVSYIIFLTLEINPICESYIEGKVIISKDDRNSIVWANKKEIALSPFEIANLHNQANVLSDFLPSEKTYSSNIEIENGRLHGFINYIRTKRQTLN